METQKSMIDLFQKRRIISYQRQRGRRQDLIKASRLALLAEEEQSNQVVEEQGLQIKEEIQMGLVNNLKHQKVKRKRNNNYSNKLRIKKKLQVPDYLISIPNDFSCFMMYARPSGKKVLISFQGTKVIIANKFGTIISMFNSKYISSNSRTVLEGIVDQNCPTKVYITDLILWKGDLKVGEQFQFRYFWLNSNLPKLFFNQQNDFKFILLDIHPVNKENFRKIYQEKLEYIKDGLIFVDPKSLYQQTNNHGVLYWKDTNTSPYCHFQFPFTAFAIIKDGGLYSLDNQLLVSFSQQQNQQFSKYKQMKFEYTSIQLQQNQMIEGQVKVQLQGLHCIQLFPYYKHIPDTLSKLIFNYKFQKQPLVAQQIYQSLN